MIVDLDAPAAMLEIENLDIRYPGPPELLAVDRVSLTVAAGTSLGLVGESGSGKSSVARAVVALVPAAGGSIHVAGVDVTNPHGRVERHLRETVQLVFQDPMSSLNPRMTVGATLEEAATVRQRLAGGDRRREVLRLLNIVGLPTRFAERYPGQLSGGQCQRVAIARALGARPRLLLLDEVTAALDVSVQATILNLLRDLRRELNLAYLVISHDLAVVRYLCDSVAVLQLGRLMEEAPAETLFERPTHPYTRALLDAVPTLEEVGTQRMPLAGDPPDPHERPTGCVFHTRCPIGPAMHPERIVCTAAEPLLAAVGRDARAACHFPLGDASDSVPVAAPLARPR